MREDLCLMDFGNDLIDYLTLCSKWTLWYEEKCVFPQEREQVLYCSAFSGSISSAFSGLEIHEKEGRPNPSYAFYLIEYLEEAVDEGVPEETVREIEKALDENDEEKLADAVKKAWEIRE